MCSLLPASHGPVETAVVQADGEKVMGLFKGRAIAESAPGSRLHLFWIMEIGQLALLLHGLDPFHSPAVSIRTCHPSVTA